jgi:thiosulfate/3-mercaptopyruvate sulfurtransferase
MMPGTIAVSGQTDPYQLSSRRKQTMMVRTLLLLFLTSFAANLLAKPLVDAVWLNQNMKDGNLVVLDLQDAKSFQRHHIPGAVNTNYAEWRDKSEKGIPKLMPPVSRLEKMIGSLGIGNDNHVVIVALGSGAGDLASSTRIYWTFKALGHDQISILNGGMIAYAEKRTYPLARGAAKPEPKTFKANPRLNYFPDAQGVKALLTKGALPVDNRSRPEYLGIYRGGEKERPGSLPNATNLSYDWLTVNGSGQLQSLPNIKKIYAASETPLTGPQVNYCHTGHRASLGWFVSHELLGNKEAVLYDGSTVEWAIDPSLPMEQLVKVELN